MPDHTPPSEIDAARRALQTPRAAAIAGIAFALLMGAAVALMRWAIPAEPADAGEWLTDDARRRSFDVALQLVPFAGIAFLWFIGVVRTRIGDAEDRFFATVFLGSGLLFIAMLFATAAVGAGLVGTSGAAAGRPDPEVWQFGREATWTLTNVYAMRMAAVFAISTRPSACGSASSHGGSASSGSSPPARCSSAALRTRGSPSRSRAGSSS